MSSTSANPPKKYMFHKGRNKWVISISEDPGIISNMRALNAEVYAPSESRKYWLLNKDAFNSILPLLNAAGYIEHVQEPQEPTAQFSVSPKKAEDPLCNPIKFPAIALKTPQIAAEFLQNHTFSISEFNTSLKEGLSAAFPFQIWICGEISGFTIRSGHVYIDLVEHVSGNMPKDYSLKAIIWKQTYSSFLAKIQNGSLPEFNIGQKIRVLGTIDLYSQGGNLSFIIHDIDTFFAEGEFYKQKEIILNRLKSEGLDKLNLNRPMPFLPLRLAVFTRPHTKDNDGAAGWGDFSKIVSSSGFPFQITTFSVAVQGVNVESSFMNAFDNLNKIGTDQFDLCIILRGGGGVVELACFNNYNIAKRIAETPLKFIIAVGHDKDRSVLDEIATRMETPSAIAETLCNRCTELYSQLIHDKEKIFSRVYAILDTKKKDLRHLSDSCASCVRYKKQEASSSLRLLSNQITQSSLNRIRENKFKLQSLSKDLNFSGTQNIHRETTNLNNYKSDISNAAHRICTSQLHELDHLASRIHTISQIRIQSERASLQKKASLIVERVNAAKQKQQMRLDNLKTKFEERNPESIFKRGFVLLSDEQNHLVSSIQNIKLDDNLIVRMLDGKFTVTVNDISHSNESSAPSATPASTRKSKKKSVNSADDSKSVHKASKSADKATKSADKATKSADKATKSADKATKSADKATKSADKATKSAESPTNSRKSVKKSDKEKI